MSHISHIKSHHDVNCHSTCEHDVVWWTTQSHRLCLNSSKNIFNTDVVLNKQMWISWSKFYNNLVNGKVEEIHRIIQSSDRFVNWKRFHLQVGTTSLLFFERWFGNWEKNCSDLTQITIARCRGLMPRSYFSNRRWTTQSGCSLTRKQVCETTLFMICV